MRPDVVVLLLATLARSCDAYAYRICGNYCGPGWCNAEYLAEDSCNDTATSESDSCADACCKVHDKCCGHTTPSTGKRDCNTEIVACLKACDGHSNCTSQLGLEVPIWVITDGMQIAEDWCCGDPKCTNATDVEGAVAVEGVETVEAAAGGAAAVAMV